MNERFTLDSTVTEISENERVNKKLPIFFDLALCSQIKWPFSKMKLKNMMKMTKFPGQELVDALDRLCVLAHRKFQRTFHCPAHIGSLDRLELEYRAAA